MGKPVTSTAAKPVTSTAAKPVTSTAAKPVTSTAAKPKVQKALLFGLNYAYDESMKLFGCINDVKNTAEYLKTQGFDCKVYTDDTDRVNTSRNGIVQAIYAAAIDTHKSNVDVLWMHYSGHGASVFDFNKDEKDGRDECLVPSDAKMFGVVPDDVISNLFRHFNPKTKVIFVFDCCHSATMGDVKYSWEGPKSMTLENPNCRASCKIITLSACLDTQTAADGWDEKKREAAGAMTLCLLEVLKSSPKGVTNDIFTLIDKVRTNIASKGYSQTAKLCSTYNLALDKNLI